VSVFAYRAKPGGVPFDSNRCAACLMTRISTYQCSSKIKYYEPDNHGKGQTYGWCALHAPSKVKARRDRKDAKRRLESEAFDAAVAAGNAVIRAERALINAAVRLRVPALESEISTLLAAREVRRVSKP